MPRDLLAAELAALEADSTRIEYLFEAQFQTQTLYLWTGNSDIDLSGTVYQGNGWLQIIGNIRETKGTISNPITIKLTGIPTELIWLIMNAAQGQYYGKVYTAFFNDSDVFVGSDLLFSGQLDSIDLLEKPNTSQISLVYESKLARLNNTREIRMTDKEQRETFPNDKGFSLVESLKQLRFYWGRSDTSRTNV